MGLSKQQKHKNSLIQKEQQQLLKIQKELVNVLVKVNEAINVLKVEELQLKSSTVVFDRQALLDEVPAKQQAFEQTPFDLNPSVSHRSLRETKGNMHLNLNIGKREEIEEFEDDDNEI